mgnify:CR=1 FL=1
MKTPFLAVKVAFIPIFPNPDMSCPLSADATTEPLKLVNPEPPPTNEVADKAPLAELNERLVPVFGN